MSNQEQEIEVRDIRQKDFFRVDDTYLNGYARVCGIYATGVYMALCRHADNSSQTCFPSISIIARKLNISRSQVIRALKKLESLNIIKKVKQEGRHNIYYLVDKRFWLTQPVSTRNQYPTDTSVYQTPVSTRHQPVSDRHQTSVPQTPLPVSDRHPKDTHIKDTHIRIHNKGMDGDDVCTQSDKSDFVPSIQKIVFDKEKMCFVNLEHLLTKWKEAYPAVNIEQEIKAMEAWVASQPLSRWKKDWRRFITNWLSREQDKAEIRMASSKKQGGFLDDWMAGISTRDS